MAYRLTYSQVRHIIIIMRNWQIVVGLYLISIQPPPPCHFYCSLQCHNHAYYYYRLINILHCMLSPKFIISHILSLSLVSTIFTFILIFTIEYTLLHRPHSVYVWDLHVYTGYIVVYAGCIVVYAGCIVVTRAFEDIIV